MPVHSLKWFKFYLVLIVTISCTKFQNIQSQRDESAAKSKHEDAVCIVSTESESMALPFLTDLHVH